MFNIGEWRYKCSNIDEKNHCRPEFELTIPV